MPPQPAAGAEYGAGSYWASAGVWSIGHVGYDTVSVRSPNRDPGTCRVGQIFPVVFVPGWRSTSRAEAVPQLAQGVTPYTQVCESWRRQPLSGTFRSVRGSSARQRCCSKQDWLTASRLAWPAK
jgi:hypothetical protein